MVIRVILTAFTFNMGIACASMVPVDPALKPIRPLPAQLHECSGLERIADDLYVGLNDSGNPAEIYIFSLKDNKAARVVRILQAENYDWEELTSDDTYLYIGDTGNNSGNRHDLTIYRLSKDQVLRSDDVKAEKITFEYPEQVHFKPSNRHNFDCEAMVAFGDSLYLFTKNRGNLKTTMYALPKTLGHHQASRKDEFDAEGLITGAALQSDGETHRLTLIGYTTEDKGYHPFIYVFDSVENAGFLSTPVHKLQFKGSLQTETILFLGRDRLMITNEEEHGDEGFMYSVALGSGH